MSTTLTARVTALENSLTAFEKRLATLEAQQAKGEERDSRSVAKVAEEALEELGRMSMVSCWTVT